MLDNKGFDLWADGYDKSVGLSEEGNTYPFAGYKDVLNTIFNEIMSAENPTVLDIGFGTGVLTKRLYECGCEVYGQDFSERMIELAGEKMPNAHLYQGDFTRGLVPELKKRTYDYIVGTYSIHHLTDKEKVRFVYSLLALLKENGKILIGDVAFHTREELEACKNASGDAWDEDEIYFVFDELKEAFPEQLKFQPISHCAGVLIFENVVKVPEKAELWDAYYADGTLAGKDLVRGEDVPEGLYHMVCEILVRHKDGSFLVMQRDWNKTMYAGFYEATAGGSALKGETALEAAMRELREETGINVEAEDFIFLGEVLGGNSIYKEFMCITDCDKDSVTLQEGETISYQWMEPKEFFELVETDQYVPIQRERRVDLYKKIKEEENL